MTRLTLAAVLLLLPAALLRADDPPKAQDKDLEGDWTPVSVERDGKILALPPVPDGSVTTFKGNETTLKFGDKITTGNFKVDPSKTPKTIDFMPTDGPQKGKTLPGVYEIKGDELRICRADPGKDRPAEVSTKEGGATLVTLKRVKK